MASHQRFRDSFNLSFPLLADTRKQAIKAYGVNGPLGFGVRRVTFAIGQDGIVTNRLVSDFGIKQHGSFVDRVVDDL